MEVPLSADMQSYLGVKGSEFSSFTLNQINSKLVLVEFFSALCPDCHKNAPKVNRLYNIIENDTDLNSTIKMLGIAVGNDSKLVDVYKNKYNVKFPIITDPKSDIDNLLGNVGTPSIVLVDAQGKILFIHEGVIDDMDLLLEILHTFQSQ